MVHAAPIPSGLIGLGEAAGRVALVRIAAAIQERIERYQRDSTVIQAWQPDLVPGVLQTPDYTAAMLAEPGRSWQLLISEAVLRWPLGSGVAACTLLARLSEGHRSPDQ